MRFLELKLKPFGRFENETVRFASIDHATGGFHMIIGPNEAGKSTTLAAIERFLFGFPPKDIYNFLGRKNLWVGATLQFGSGESMGLWRKNAQKNSLFGENQLDPRPATLLENALDPIDSKTYMKLFGLNQDKLREGGKKLVSGESEFADILFGESLGDLHLFDKIRAMLKTSADELFKLDGRARTPLNTLKSKIEDLNLRLQESGTRLSVWNELQSSREARQKDLQEIEAEISLRNAQLTATQNRIRSREHVESLNSLQTELQAYQDLPQVPEGLHNEYTRIAARLAEDIREIENGVEEIRQTREKVNAILVRQHLLDQGAEIVDLADRASAIDSERIRLAELTDKIEKQRINLKENAFRMGFDFAQPEAIPRLDDRAKKRLDKIGQSIKSLNQEMLQAEIEVKSIGRSLEKLRREKTEEAYSESELTTINAFLQRLREILNDQQHLREIRKQQHKIQSELNASIRELPFWSGDLDAFNSLSLPDRESVEAAENQLQKAISSQDLAEHKWQELKREVRALDNSLTERRKQLTLPSLEDLLAVRQERDEAWAEIEARWRQSVEMSAHEKSVSASTFTQLMKNADRIADQLRDHAEIVTQMLLLEDLKSRRDAAGIHFEEASQKRDDALSHWQSFFPFLNEKPVIPASVRPWLTIYPRVAQLNSELASTEFQTTEIQSLWPVFRDEIKVSPYAGLILDAPTADVAETLLETRRNQITSTKVLESERVANLKKKKEELDAQQLLLEEKKRELQNTYAQWTDGLRQHGLNVDLSPDEFALFAASLDQFHRDLNIHQLDLESKSSIQDKLADFDMNTHKLAEAVGFREETESTVATIRALKAQVDEEREKLDKIFRLESSIASAESKIQVRTARREVDEATIKDILNQIDVEQIDQAEARFALIAERNRLNSLIGQKHDLLSQLRGSIELEAWITCVSSETPEEAQSLTNALTDQLKELKEKRNQALEQIGALNKQQSDIRRKVSEAQSLDARNEQSVLIENTNTNIRNYLKYAITNRILEEASQDYRKRMGDDVLNNASRYFRALSLNSFDGVRPLPTDAGGNSLVAVRDMSDPDSHEFKLNDLSEGTRDQLFLALKLAMIRNRLNERRKQGQAPLPVILDDILVQFDDERSTAAFRLLGELAEITQVIFLTHHQHLEEVARNAFGDRSFGVHYLTSSSRTLQEQN